MNRETLEEAIARADRAEHTLSPESDRAPGEEQLADLEALLSKVPVARWLACTEATAYSRPPGDSGRDRWCVIEFYKDDPPIAYCDDCGMLAARAALAHRLMKIHEAQHPQRKEIANG